MAVFAAMVSIVAGAEWLVLSVMAIVIDERLENEEDELVYLNLQKD